MTRVQKGYLYTIFAAIAWGFSGVCGELILNHYQVDSGWLTSVRMLIAGICLFVYVQLNPQQKQMNSQMTGQKANWLTLFIYGVFGLLFLQYTYIRAIQASNSGTATMLQYLGPVFIVIYMCYKDRRTPHLFELTALGLSLVGTIIMATNGNLSALNLSPAALFWGIGSALGVLIYTIIPMSLIRTYNSTLVVTYGFLIGGSVSALAFKIWTIPVQANPRLVILVLIMSLVGTVLAFAIYLQGVSMIGPVSASMIACLEPISAIIFSILLLGHQFKPMELLGMATLMVGVSFITLKDLVVSRNMGMEQ